MNVDSEDSAAVIKSATGYGEYDEETAERIHQESIRKSKLAAEESKRLGNTADLTTPKQYTWKGAPRHVSDHEISSYQGTGGKRQMQRAQSRKRRQVRRREASIWDSLAPNRLLINLAGRRFSSTESLPYTRDAHQNRDSASE